MTKVKEKKTLSNSYIRQAFYETSDGVSRLVAASELLKDKELEKLAKELQTKLDQYRVNITDKYNWD